MLLCVSMAMAGVGVILVEIRGAGIFKLSQVEVYGSNCEKFAIPAASSN